jgi:glycerophosphoryl diester phosphodiesterase
VELGADGLEMDLRITRDGRFVVLHDATLGRTTSGRGWVHLCSAAYVRHLDAGAWFRGRTSLDRVPFLEEVLDELPSHLLLNLEIKAGVLGVHRWRSRLAQAIVARGAQPRVLISSFSAQVLRSIRWLNPELRVASLGESVERALAVGAAALHPRAAATSASLIAHAHAAGLRVHPWDADDRVDWDRLLALGVDGIITDEVRSLRALLQARAESPASPDEGSRRQK